MGPGWAACHPMECCVCLFPKAVSWGPLAVSWPRPRNFPESQRSHSCLSQASLGSTPGRGPPLPLPSLSPPWNPAAGSGRGKLALHTMLFYKYKFLLLPLVWNPKAIKAPGIPASGVSPLPRGTEHRPAQGCSTWGRGSGETGRGGGGLAGVRLRGHRGHEEEGGIIY